MISSVKYLDEVDMPKDEFAICMSGILALMGIRDNEDLDIITDNDSDNSLSGGGTSQIAILKTFFSLPVVINFL